MQSAPVRRVGRDLTQGSILQGLLFFAFPIIITNLIQQLYSMVDLMIIGQFVGNTGTVGVATGGEVSDFLTPVATAFATAGQIYIAQLAGARRTREQREALGTFLSLMFIFAFIFMMVTICFHKGILNVLHCPPEAYHEAENYMIITAVGLPFIFGYNAVCGILRGLGESKRPLIFVSVAAVVNIFLDLLLVAAFHMSAAGTAIATVVSQIISFATALVYMFHIREQLGVEMSWSSLRIKQEPACIIMKLGIPQALRSVLVRISMLWVNASVNAYGIVPSSTNSVGNKLQKFLEIFSTSLTQAGGAMVGQNLGAKAQDRAKKVVYYTLASCLTFATVISVVVALWPKAVFGIFTQDALVKEMGVTYLHIMIVHFFSTAITSSFQCMVVGVGNAPLNFALGVLDGLVCKIGLSLLFVNVLGLGVYGYFWATALSRVLPGVICILYFYSNRWRHYQLLHD